MPAKCRAAQIAFRYRTADSPAGVTRETALRIAETLGVDETQAIHLALREIAVRVLPQYAPDDGQLAAAQLRQVRRLAGKVAKGPVRSTLVDVEES